jgi:hypothetical protein
MNRKSLFPDDFETVHGDEIRGRLNSSVHVKIRRHPAEKPESGSPANPER